MGEAGIDVWATGDGVRVNPETGRYLEDRTDIHADYPTGDYRGRNAVWDAAAGRIRLRAARDEFVAFQVVVESAEPVTGVTVALDRLTGPGDVEIAGRNVALFKAWYVQVTRKSTGYDAVSLGPAWYGDALIPTPEGQAVRFDLPCGANAIGPSQRNQSVWVDVYVPRDPEAAPSGTYAGELVVGFPGGEKRLAVELAVWDFALPADFGLRGDVWNESILNMLDEQPQRARKFYQFAHRHRFHPGVPRLRPDIAVDGSNVAIDWTRYDEQLKPYFDGSAFSSAAGYWGPGEGVGIDHILLPFDNVKPGREGREWPVAVPAEGPREPAEAVWVEAARQFREHFDADETWSKVERIAFIDSLDESYNESAYEKMVYFAKLLRRGLGEGWFKHRIDGGFSAEAMEVLTPYVDLWVCHTAGFDSGRIAAFQAAGGEAWHYGPLIYEQRKNSACGSNTFIDLDLLTCRGIGWAAWKHRSGYCEWEFDWHADDAWSDPVNYENKSNAFNGSGLFIYHGNALGTDDPIPSIRLKAHRRGFQDYEYLRMLRDAGRGDDADRLVNGIVHTTPFGDAAMEVTEIWANDPEAWDAARIEAGELLAGG